MRLKRFAFLPLTLLILAVAIVNVSYSDQPYMYRRNIGLREDLEWKGVVPYSWKATFGEYAGRTINGYAYFEDRYASPFTLWLIHAYPIEAQAVKVIIGPAQNVNSILGQVEWRSWGGYEGYAWNEGNTRVFVYATYSIGSARIEATLAPNPIFVNQPVSLSGTVFASWKNIHDGHLANMAVRIAPSWTTETTATTDSQGQFHATLIAPSTLGQYTVSLSTSDDGDIACGSQLLTLAVCQVKPTCLSLGKQFTSYGMGSATKFYGYLKEKDANKPVPSKIVRLTVYSGGYGFIFDVTTNSQGYYDYMFTTNNGIFSWAEARFNGDSSFQPSCSLRIT